MKELQYPIGEFEWNGDISAEQRRLWIKDLADAPAQLRAAVSGLSEAQLDTPYRPEGWTVRQVVHHLPDSHLNSYMRFKLAVSEDEPTIRPYDEQGWAMTKEAQNGPIEMSLQLLEALHTRWVAFLQTLSDEEYQRSFLHPENPGKQRLDYTLGSYSWHSRHHIAHITSLRKRKGW